MIKKLLFLNMLIVVSIHGMEQGNAGSAGNLGMPLSFSQEVSSLAPFVSELSKENLPDHIKLALGIDSDTIKQVSKTPFPSAFARKLIQRASTVELVFEEAAPLLKDTDTHEIKSYIKMYNKLLYGPTGLNGLLWSIDYNEQSKKKAVSLFYKKVTALIFFVESLQGVEKTRIKKGLSAETKEGELQPLAQVPRSPCFQDDEYFQKATEGNATELIEVLKLTDGFGVPLCVNDRDYNSEMAKQQFSTLFDPFDRDKDQRKFETNVQSFLESAKLLSLVENKKAVAGIIANHPAKEWLLQQGENYYKKSFRGDIKFFSKDCCYFFNDNGVCNIQTGKCVCYMIDLLRSRSKRELEKRRFCGYSSGPDHISDRSSIEKACSSGMKAFSPDGNYLVSVYSKEKYNWSSYSLEWKRDRDQHTEVIEVFDVRNKTACFIREADASGSKYYSNEYQFSFSPDSNFLYLVGPCSGEQYECDLKNWSLKKIHTCPIWAAFTENHSTSTDDHLVGKYRVVRLENAITITNNETGKIITVHGEELELSPNNRYILSKECIKTLKSNMNVPDKKVVEKSGVLDINDIIALDQILSEDLALEQIVALISIYEKDKNNGIFQIPGALAEHFNSLPENIKKMLHDYCPE